MKEPELTIVIPTYNEGDIIESALKRLSTALGDVRSRTEVIIADDGTDDLPEVAERTAASFGFESLKVMRNSPPLGKGGAIRAAFAVSRGAIVGFIDVDFSVDPLRIHDAVKEIKAGNDICIASRVGNRWKSDHSFVTSIMGSIFNFTHRRLLFGSGRKFSDTQCGFKFFKREIAQSLYKDLVASDGLNDLEVLLKAVRHGYSVAELPVPRKNDRVGKIRISTILTRETRSLARIFCKYRLGFDIKSASIEAIGPSKAS